MLFCFHIPVGQMADDLEKTPETVLVQEDPEEMEQTGLTVIPFEDEDPGVLYKYKPPIVDVPETSPFEP